LGKVASEVGSLINIHRSRPGNKEAKPKKVKWKWVGPTQFLQESGGKTEGGKRRGGGRLIQEEEGGGDETSSSKKRELSMVSKGQRKNRRIANKDGTAKGRGARWKKEKGGTGSSFSNIENAEPIS